MGGVGVGTHPAFRTQLSGGLTSIVLPEILAGFLGQLCGSPSILTQLSTTEYPCWTKFFSSHLSGQTSFLGYQLCGTLVGLSFFSGQLCGSYNFMGTFRQPAFCAHLGNQLSGCTSFQGTSFRGLLDDTLSGWGVIMLNTQYFRSSIHINFSTSKACLKPRPCLNVIDCACASRHKAHRSARQQ